jgi:hypothetical protein
MLAKQIAPQRRMYLECSLLLSRQSGIFAAFTIHFLLVQLQVNKDSLVMEKPLPSPLCFANTVLIFAVRKANSEIDDKNVNTTSVQLSAYVLLDVSQNYDPYP